MEILFGETFAPVTATRSSISYPSFVASAMVVLEYIPLGPGFMGTPTAERGIYGPGCSHILDADDT